MNETDRNDAKAGIGSFIPNALTILNILSGTIALILASKGYIITSAFFFIFCLILDFLDGFAAKLLNAGSELGKQLDSLADVVSFGVYPSIAMYFTLEESIRPMSENDPALLPFTVILIPAMGALRLAIYNIEEQQSDFFRGLPIPSAAAGLIAYAFVLQAICPCNSLHNILAAPWLQVTAVVFYSFLMITKIPMMSLKAKNFTWNENRVRIIFILLAIAAFIFFPYITLVLIIPFYILWSLIFIRKEKK